MRWIQYEPITPALELRDEMLVAATPSVGYYSMLILSACLATLGLIVDSTAVIIGAMIVAPLMNPMIACSFACVRGNLPILGRSILSIVTGVGLVVLVSVSVTLAVDSQLEGKEILSRANPSLLDLGIAAASGIAGAIAWSRRRIANTLPGVAISVALVPPLCTAGIGLAIGDSAVRDPLHSYLDEIQSIELGAFILFLTNFAAILLFGGIVFLFHGYGRFKSATAGLLISLGLTILLAIPLVTSFQKFHLRSEIIRTLKDLSAEFPDWEFSRLRRMQIDFADDGAIEVRLKADAAVDTLDQDDATAIQRALEDRYNRPVRVELMVIEYEVYGRREGGDGAEGERTGNKD